MPSHRDASAGSVRLRVLLLALILPAVSARARQVSSSESTPLVVGETFSIESAVLGESRRINVYRPPEYAAPAGVPLPVLYMPDGGIQEDFVHVAGLVQVGAGNGTMRPFLLVGIENTARRRDLTGPTSVSSDREIAPEVGGSAAFRSFLRDELMPEVRSRYRTTDETAIVGESLAGLFVIETLVLEPGLFDTYIAFDPSLWWNGGALVDEAESRTEAIGDRAVFLANSDQPEIAALTARLAALLQESAPDGATRLYVPMVAETHATIYHPAALVAFRQLFPPTP